MADVNETVVTDEVVVDTPEDVKTFTQDEVDAAVTARLARESEKAKSTMLTELGIEDLEQAKADLKAYNELKESQKTEQDKQAEQLVAKEQLVADLEAEKSALSAKVSMLSKGVKSDAMDDVAVLAGRLVGEEVTMDDAIDQVLEKYPSFKAGEVEDEASPSFVKDGNMSASSKDLDPFQAKLNKWK